MNREQLIKILDGHTKTLQASNRAADAILDALMREEALANMQRVVDFDVTTNEAAEPIRTTREGLTESRMQDLVRWWVELSSEEAERTVPKAIEYGADDLIEIGRSLAAVVELDLEPDEAAEWGIYFYMIGKIGRWTAAIRDRRRVSDDTIFDIKVYATMVQRIRAAGGWPGV